MFNIQQAMQMMKLIQNPQQFLTKMGVPKEYTDSPENVANFILNNGSVTQGQIEQAKNIYNQNFR